MNSKENLTPYSERTPEELRAATKEFDEEFAADRAVPLSSDLMARWKRAQAKLCETENGSIEQTVSVRLNKELLERCNALAKKKSISRDALFARGLLVLLTAEGEF